KVFSRPLRQPITDLPALPPLNGDAPPEQRARAYLHANCSHCHRPQGGARGELDLRYGTPLRDAHACGVAAATGGLGIDGATLLVPGDPSKSLVSIRPRATGLYRMPPFASSLVNLQGLDVVDSWIATLPACP